MNGLGKYSLAFLAASFLAATPLFSSASDANGDYLTCFAYFKLQKPHIDNRRKLRKEGWTTWESNPQFMVKSLSEKEKEKTNSFDVPVVELEAIEAGWFQYSTMNRAGEALTILFEPEQKVFISINREVAGGVGGACQR